MSSSTRSVLRFLGKMLAAYVVWYVLYDLWLLPDGRLDAWVSHSVVDVSGAVLALLGFAPDAAGRVVALPGTAGVRIVNGCNGLSTIGLFVGFILAYPGDWTRRAWFIPLGTAVIYAANVGRITLLAGLQRYAPELFSSIHNLGAPAFFYAVVFGLWMVWTHYGSINSDAAEDAPPAARVSSTVASS